MWTVESTSPTLATIRCDVIRNKKWEQWVLLSSDRHFDNPLSRLDMQRKHLDLAMQRNAPVIDLGDLYCAMQRQTDRRSSKGSVREENIEPDYFGSLTRSGVNFFGPYQEILAVMGKGNHELAVRKHAEYDLTKNLVDRLHDRGSGVVEGGFCGWVQFRFTEKKAFTRTFNLYYTHGAGGNAVVTKGVINTNRRAVYLPDAHIVAGGHIHEAWSVEMCRHRLTERGSEYVDEQIHLCVPTYKDEWSGQKEGFHVETEKAPKPLGAWWIRFYWESTDHRMKFECIRAK